MFFWYFLEENCIFYLRSFATLSPSKTLFFFYTIRKSSKLFPCCIFTNHLKMLSFFFFYFLLQEKTYYTQINFSCQIFNVESGYHYYAAFTVKRRKKMSKTVDHRHAPQQTRPRGKATYRPN